MVAPIAGAAASGASAIGTGVAGVGSAIGAGAAGVGSAIGLGKSLATGVGGTIGKGVGGAAGAYTDFTRGSSFGAAVGAGLEAQNPWMKGLAAFSDAQSLQQFAEDIFPKVITKDAKGKFVFDAEAARTIIPKAIGKHWAQGNLNVHTIADGMDLLEPITYLDRLRQSDLKKLKNIGEEKNRKWFDTDVVSKVFPQSERPPHPEYMSTEQQMRVAEFPGKHMTRDDPQFRLLQRYFPDTDFPNPKQALKQWEDSYNETVGYHKDSEGMITGDREDIEWEAVQRMGRKIGVEPIFVGAPGAEGRFDELEALEKGLQVEGYQKERSDYFSSLKENIESGEISEEDAEAIESFYEMLQKKIEDRVIDKKKAAKLFDNFTKRLAGK